MEEGGKQCMSWAKVAFKGFQWLRSGGIGFALAYLLAYILTRYLPETNLPERQIVEVLGPILSALIHAALNALKHRNDRKPTPPPRSTTSGGRHPMNYRNPATPTG